VTRDKIKIRNQIPGNKSQVVEQRMKFNRTKRKIQMKCITTGLLKNFNNYSNYNNYNLSPPP